MVSTKSPLGKIGNSIKFCPVFPGPGVERPAGERHFRKQRSLYKDLLAARPEKEVPDEGTQKEPQSGFQRNVSVQVRFTHSKSALIAGDIKGIMVIRGLNEMKPVCNFLVKSKYKNTER